MRIQQYNYIVFSLDYFAGCTPMRIQQRGSKICSVKLAVLWLGWMHSYEDTTALLQSGCILRDCISEMLRRIFQRTLATEIVS